jgi:hypothetical protein
MKDDNEIKWHEKLFLYTLYLSWILYPLSFIVETQYHVNNTVQIVDLGLKLYISLVLIYKFNPWFGKQNFTLFDRRLAWHAGVFLFISTLSVTIIDVFKNIYLPISNYILK